MSKQVTVLCSQYRTTLTEVKAGIFGNATQKLYLAARQHGIEIAGSLMWVYYGSDGDLHKPFDLLIAVPIRPTDINVSPFEIRVLPPFNYMRHKHMGEWENIMEGYSSIFTEMANTKYKPIDQSREIYVAIDPNNPANNITEIQIGVA